MRIQPKPLQIRVIQSLQRILPEQIFRGIGRPAVLRIAAGNCIQKRRVRKENFGFKVVMMIPPYKRSNRRVRFRPASNFRLTYNQEADAYAGKMYTTDPEENEREGWFDRSRSDWGANGMTPDFTVWQKGGTE